MVSTVEVGTVSVPLLTGLGMNQTYEEVGGRTRLRMLDGTALTQQNWAKLKTTISGYGIAPAGLSGIDYSAHHVLKCAVPRSVGGLTTSITIPAARRTDAGYEPVGFARIGKDVVKTSVVSVVANVVTLTAVGGADSYIVAYWPQFTAWLDLKESFNRDKGEHQWSLDGEEA